MSSKTVATPAFLAKNLTPLDLELVLGLTQQAAARSQDVRLVIRDDESCVRLTCEPTPVPSAPSAPLGRLDLTSVA